MWVNAKGTKKERRKDGWNRENEDTDERGVKEKENKEEVEEEEKKKE